MPLLTISDLNQPQQQLTPYLELANRLSQMYFDYIQSVQDESYKYTVEVFGSAGRKNGIHASEMSNCLRLMVYSLMNTQRWSDPSSTDVNMLMRFNLGTAVHAMVQNDWHRIAAKTGGWLHFQDEVPISPEFGGMAAKWGLHSSCDGVFTFLDPQSHPILRVGLEIKTESGPQFEKLKAPRDYHREQTTLYQAALDVPLMWVFYYNKSNSNITTSYAPYLYQFDPKLWEKLEARFAQAYQLAHAQQLPDRSEGMHCKWCPFSYTCQPAALKGTPPKRDRLAQGMRKRQR